MKFVILALSLCFSTSAFAQVTTLNTLIGPTEPPVEKMTAAQLSGHLGKNVIRLAGACSVSSWALVLSAVTETVPMVTALSSMATQIKLSDDKDLHSYDAEFQWTRDKDVGHAVGGGALSFVTDLAQIGYYFVFDDKGQALERALAMPNTKKGYAATTALAKRFYGKNDKGECGKAGRQIVDVLSLIQTNRP